MKNLNEIESASKTEENSIANNEKTTSSPNFEGSLSEAKREAPEGSNQENDRLIKWQTRLLPFMGILLLGLTIFFLGASIYQLYGLKSSIVSSPQSTLENEMEALRPAQGDLPSNTFEKTRWATLVRLEANAIERRYHQANTLLLARVWTIYLGFLTGMILSLVGAAFILGKLRETASEINLGGNAWKAGIQSASPGIILAFLGTTLMIVTMLAHVDIKVNDSPLYVTDVGGIPQNNNENNNENTNQNLENPKGKDRISVNKKGADDEQQNLDDAGSKLNNLPEKPSKNPSNSNKGEDHAN